MEMEIYGLKFFSKIANLFDTPLGIVLFSIIIFLALYIFIKHNFSFKNKIGNDIFFDDGRFYFENAMLFIITLTVLLVFGHYIIFENLFLSVIFTGIFYAVSIFLMTLFLIFMKRYQIKKFILYELNTINDMLINKKPIKEYVQKVFWYTVFMKHNNLEYKFVYDKDHLILQRTKGELKEIEHMYVVKFIDALSKINLKDGINIEPFKNINIFQDVNMKAKYYNGKD
jgi:hypothetical protein